MYNLSIIEGVCGVVLLGLLLSLAIIDSRTYRLPNVLTYSLIALGFCQAIVLKLNFYHHLMGMVIGYSAFVGVELAFKYIRGKQGLGRGDAKLLAAGGAWCGWMALPYIVLISSLIGIGMALKTQGMKNDAIPFGPALAFGIMIVWLISHYTDYLPA